jgi:hypothetical protein
MELRPFEQELLSASGNAQDKLERFFGIRISRSNANKRWTGMKMLLEHIQNMEPEEIENELKELRTFSDGTRESTRLMRIVDLENKSASELLKLHNYNPAQWTLKDSHQSIWHSPQKDDDPRELYASKISVKPLENPLSEDQIKDVFDKLEPPQLHIYPKTRGGNLMLELPIMDLHLGKLSWKAEAGENYNLHIAIKLFKFVVEDILNQINEYNLKIEKIIFPIGQDFFHFDNSELKTTAGTQMDSDIRWQKMFSKGLELMIWAIENLRRLAPVECMYVTSNHDKVLSYCLTQAIAAWYRKCDNVNIDTSPLPRKYIKYGKCLIGFSHGSEESKRIETIMQAENPKQWGRTTFREWHLAHLHSEQVKEISGIIIRHISSITAIDAWHKEKGYLALRKAQAFIWDKEKGKRLTIDVNVTA